ncbi:MAG: sodium:solute symporter, partial [Opitutae bacterium]|nr:sodium:solute symporter [Opitutae bacterium]
MRLTLPDWLAIAAYFVSLVAIGVYCARRQGSLDEYFLGRRRFGALVMSISVLGTATSAITFLGVPGFVVARDWSILASGVVGAPAALLVAGVFVPVFYALRLTSVYEYLEHRFDRRVAMFNSVLFLLMRGTLAGVAIFAPSIALSIVTGWDVTLCIVLSATLTIVYTTIGGMSAVVWTELLQVIVLFGGALFITVYLALQLDGSPADWWLRASAAHKFNVLDFRFPSSEITFWSSAVGGLVFHVAL